MILSIIIPAYNVEQYIRECLDSILCQINHSESIEIIVVDDGSPDRSGEIAEEYCRKYKFFKIFRKENGGLSSARNFGLNHAIGEYVWFIDSDDWISMNSIEKIIDIITNYNEKHSEPLDAVGIEAINIIGNRQENHFRYKTNTQEISDGVSRLRDRNFSCCAPFTIYRRSFIVSNKLSFKEGIFHEDLEFTPRAYYKLKSIYALKEIIYLVRQNPTSITRSFNIKKNFDLLIVAESLEAYKKEQVQDSDISIFSGLIARVLNNSFKGVHLFSEEQYGAFLNSISYNKILNYLKSRRLKYLVIGLALLINRRLTINYLSKH